LVTRIVLNDFAGHAFMVDLAEALKSAGHETTYAFCDTNLSPHGSFESASVSVVPISTKRPFEKYKVARRVVAELEYGWGSARLIRRRQADVVILNNLPLLSLAAPLLVGRMRGAHRVIWLQDVQSGLVAGVTGKQGIASRVAHRVEGFLLRRADTVIAISDGLARSAQEFGVTADRIHVIENWAPVDEVPTKPRDNDWSRAHGLGERQRFLYSGTLARKHSPEVLLALAEAVPTADVVVVSEGVGADWLAVEASERNIENLRVLPFQPFSVLPDVLASGDVLIALLTDDAGGHSVPSKVLSYLCAGRAVLASMPADNAAARMIVERARAGVVVKPGHDSDFVAAGIELLEDPDLRRKMGESGRTFAEETFSSTRVAEILTSIVSVSPSR
jgi:colanic acid biosynthesis glycosyl transferase WcaI